MPGSHNLARDRTLKPYVRTATCHPTAPISVTPYDAHVSCWPLSETFAERSLSHGKLPSWSVWKFRFQLPTLGWPSGLALLVVLRAGRRGVVMSDDLMCSVRDETALPKAPTGFKNPENLHETVSGSYVLFDTVHALKDCLTLTAATFRHSEVARIYVSRSRIDKPGPKSTPPSADTPPADLS